MTKIIYEPRTIKQIRNYGTVLVMEDIVDPKFVSVEGIVAAFKVQETPYEENSSMNRRQWEDLHGAGIVTGFLYDDNVLNILEGKHPKKEDQFLYFSARLWKGDWMGECSELAMILEASKNTNHHVRMEAEIQSAPGPRIWLHKVYLTDDFTYTTHNGYKANRTIKLSEKLR